MYRRISCTTLSTTAPEVVPFWPKPVKISVSASLFRATVMAFPGPWGLHRRRGCGRNRRAIACGKIIVSSSRSATDLGRVPAMRMVADRLDDGSAFEKVEKGISFSEGVMKIENLPPPAGDKNRGAQIG